MKICIIGENSRENMPYIERYISFFTRSEVEFDVIYWDKSSDKPEQKIQTVPNEFVFNLPVNPGMTNKIISNLKFKKFVISKLKQKAYDQLVVLTTTTAMIIKGYLKKHFENKYLFDLRNYTFENIGFYKKAVDKIIANSRLTTISSKGYMDFLNNNEKIILNHNMCFYDNKLIFSDIKSKQVINIGFIGNTRYYDENVSLIEKLKNTFRYQLWYVGKNQDCGELEEYCKKNDIKNTSFIGKYDNSQKFELYKNIDIVNSICSDDDFQSTTSLPTRLYEACLFKKPIISSKGTYLGEIIDQYGIGLVVDVFKDDVATKLGDYLYNFDNEQFSQSCENFLNDVKKDELIFFASLKQFICPDLTESSIDRDNVQTNKPNE